MKKYRRLYGKVSKKGSRYSRLSGLLFKQKLYIDKRLDPLSDWPAVDMTTRRARWHKIHKAIRDELRARGIDVAAMDQAAGRFYDY